MAAEQVAEWADEERIEREEGGPARGPYVAVLRNLHVPVAVPARPDVDDGAEVVQPRTVPAVAERVVMGVEEKERPGRQRPESEPAPGEDLERPACRALTGLHVAGIIARCPSASSPLPRLAQCWWRCGRTQSGW